MSRVKKEAQDNTRVSPFWSQSPTMTLKVCDSRSGYSQGEFFCGVCEFSVGDMGCHSMFMCKRRQCVSLYM